MSNIERWQPEPEAEPSKEPTVSELIHRDPGKNFYQELQLVYTVAQLEAVDLDNLTIITRSGEFASNPSGFAVADRHGIFLLYTLLFAIEDCTVAELLKKLTLFDDYYRGFCQELHNADGLGGGRIFRQVRQCLFAGGQLFTFWDYRIDQEVHVAGDAAFKALRRELRTYPLDPIFALGAYIRCEGMKRASFEARFGQMPGCPMEIVISAGKEGVGPKHPVPFPRILR
jgi:hypothetical protein